MGISFHFDEVGDGAPDVIEVGSCSSSDENDGGNDCSSDDADVLLERQQQLDVMKEVLDFGKQAGGRPARYFGNSDRTKRRKHAQAKDDRTSNGNTLRSMSFFTTTTEKEDDSLLEDMTLWGAGDEALLVAIAKLDSVGRSHHGAFLVRGGSAEKREAAASELPKIHLVRSYLQNVNDGMLKMEASMAAARAHRPQKVEGAAEGADPYICRMTRKWGDEFVTSAAFVDETRTWGTHAKVKSIVEACPHVRTRPRSKGAPHGPF